MSKRYKIIDLSVETSFGIAACSSLLTLVVIGMLNPTLLEFGGNKYDMSYPDAIVIILTALAVMLALFALVAAFFAVIGYKQIKKKLIDTAVTTAEPVAKKAARKVAEKAVQEEVARQMALRISLDDTSDDYAAAFGSENGEDEK